MIVMYPTRVLKYCILLMIGLSFSFSVSAQTSRSGIVRVGIPEVALVDIEPPEGSIALAFQPINEAGNSLVGNTDNSKWLNYTSAIRAGFPNHFITASISQQIPGVDINLEVSNSVSGSGTLGTPVGSITLTTTSVVIINGIRGAFTETGVNRGHQLTYSLDISDFNALMETNQNIVVSYTISN